MTPQEQRELVLLRKHYGISYHEAEHVLPAWEVNLLLAHIDA